MPQVTLSSTELKELAYNGVVWYVKGMQIAKDVQFDVFHKITQFRLTALIITTFIGFKFQNKFLNKSD